MQLSRLESEFLEELKKNTLVVFSVKDLSLLMQRNVYNILRQLKKKKILQKVGNKYALQTTDELIIASNITYPCYISCWSALSYYGLSDQIPKVIFVASTRKHKNYASIKFITISKNRFFGYTVIGPLVIAEKEKAIIDSLLFPQYSGGMTEIVRVIRTKDYDLQKLINYAKKTGSKGTLRRLGYILDYLAIADLKFTLGKGYELFDPTKNKANNFNKKWLLDVNNDIA